MQLWLSSDTRFNPVSNLRFVEFLANEDDLVHSLFVRVPKAIRDRVEHHLHSLEDHSLALAFDVQDALAPVDVDRKSTRLNSSHTVISYAVFCLKKKKKNE